MTGPLQLIELSITDRTYLYL